MLVEKNNSWGDVHDIPADLKALTALQAEIIR